MLADFISVTVQSTASVLTTKIMKNTQ